MQERQSARQTLTVGVRERKDRQVEASSAASSEQPRRGEVGKQTFERVQQLIAEGKKPTEAFAVVAEETGRAAATVATAYYRTARQMPGGGGVKARPRRGRPRGSAVSTPRASRVKSTQALVRELLEAANALARHAEDLDAALLAARRDSEAYAQIQRLIGNR
jgi:hypothetical protein